MVIKFHFAQMRNIVELGRGKRFAIHKNYGNILYILVLVKYG
jgi:hypothetical protein